MRTAALHRAVAETLASKRLGTPVFVRYLVQTHDRASSVLPRLAQVVAAIRGWLNQPIERLYALGQVKQRQLTLTLEFRGGGTALVAWSAGAAAGDGVDLMVLGNHGAIYHDFGSAAHSDDEPELLEKPDASLLALIERAARSGRVESAGR
jgi:hypothetical protein